MVEIVVHCWRRTLVVVGRHGLAPTAVGNAARYISVSGEVLVDGCSSDVLDVYCATVLDGSGNASWPLIGNICGSGWIEKASAVSC